MFVVKKKQFTGL